MNILAHKDVLKAIKSQNKQGLKDEVQQKLDNAREKISVDYEKEDQLIEEINRIENEEAPSTMTLDEKSLFDYDIRTKLYSLEEKLDYRRNVIANLEENIEYYEEYRRFLELLIAEEKVKSKKR